MVADVKIPIRGGTYEVSAQTMAALQLRFPLANVERELLLAAHWLEKNPARHPRKALRFLENWLKKSSPKAPLIDMKRAQWWASEHATLEMAKNVGVTLRAGEAWNELRARIADKLSERKSA